MKRARRRKGVMSWTKTPQRGGRTPLWQWILGVPLLAVLVIGILAFIYVAFVNPRLARGERRVQVKVLDRVEKTLPDGKLDLKNSHLLVKIEEKDVRLRPLLPDWSQVAKGDTVEVAYGPSPEDGYPQAFSWKRIAAPPSAPLR